MITWPANDDVELVPVWTPATGWLDQPYGKGALLPPHDSNSTLTDAARGRVRGERVALVVHPTEELRAQVRRWKSYGSGARKIGEQVGLSKTSVQRLLKGSR